MQEAMRGEETGATPTWPPRMVVCVGSIVLRGQRALFVRQAPGHSLAGQWSIPWGIVDQGETPEDAALRETYEESRISARIEGLAGIQNLPRASWLGIVFLCHHVEGEPRSDGVETDRAAYFSLEEMDAFGEPFEPWCEWLVRRVLGGEYRLVPRALNNPYAPRHGFL